MKSSRNLAKASRNALSEGMMRVFDRAICLCSDCYTSDNLVSRQNWYHFGKGDCDTTVSIARVL